MKNLCSSHFWLCFPQAMLDLNLSIRGHHDQPPVVCCDSGPPFPGPVATVPAAGVPINFSLPAIVWLLLCWASHFPKWSDIFGQPWRIKHLGDHDLGEGRAHNRLCCLCYTDTSIREHKANPQRIDRNTLKNNRPHQFSNSPWNPSGTGSLSGPLRSTGPRVMHLPCQLSSARAPEPPVNSVISIT